MDNKDSIMKNKIILTMTSMILTVFLVSLICASGVSAPYWKGNPLNIGPGQTDTVSLTLQNMVGDKDITMQVEITQGQEIASLKDDKYTAKAGTKDTEVPVKIEIGPNVTLGKTYTVVVSFASVTPDEEGTVTLGTAVDTTFDVVVADVEAKEQAEETQLPWLLIIGIIVVVVIIVAVIFVRKK